MVLSRRVAHSDLCLSRISLGAVLWMDSWQASPKQGNHLGCYGYNPDGW